MANALLALLGWFIISVPFSLITGRLLAVSRKAQELTVTREPLNRRADRESLDALHAPAGD